MFGKRTVLLFVLYLFGFTANAQEDEPDFYKQIEPKHSYSVEFSLPVPLANKSFKGIMQGLLKISGSYQFALKNHLAFGAGVSYNYFMINKFKTPQKVYGGLHLTTGYFKLAHEQFHSERLGTEFALKVGYSYFQIHSDSLQASIGKDYKTFATQVEPSFSLIVTSSEKTAYRWIVAYTFQGIGFDPSRIGLNTYAGYNPAGFPKITQYLSFGFAFSHYFRQW